MRTALFIAAPLAFLASSTRGNVVTLPFHDEHGHTVLFIDGQPFSFLVDSGSARFFVVHGDWFGRRYGPGSCEKHKMICYFCTMEAPCDDIETRQRFTVIYDGADELYEYVEHTGTLHLGRETVKVTFGLAVRYVGADLPEPILGLSFGRPGIPKTLLQQLKDSYVIGALSFSVLARDGKTGDFGEVILGDSEKKSVDAVHLHLTPSPWGRHLHVPIELMRLAEGPSLSRSANLRALVDTGNSFIEMPTGLFDALVEIVRDSIRSISGRRLIWYDDKQLRIRPSHVKHLPSIVYSLTGEGNSIVDIKVPPEHYLGPCTTTECMLYLYVNDQRVIALGQPFFRAYYAHVDLEKESIAVARQIRGDHV